MKEHFFYDLQTPISSSRLVRIKIGSTFAHPTICVIIQFYSAIIIKPFNKDSHCIWPAGVNVGPLEYSLQILQI